MFRQETRSEAIWKPAAHNQPPHARNPEGASAEASTLSGFSLLPQLQDPEGPGLPVKARYHLSVVPALSVSCLTASTKESRPTQTPTQPERLNRFRDHQPEFREQQPATSTQQPDRTVIWPETKRSRNRPGTTSPHTRETPRERPPKHPPSRGSQPKSACANSSLRNPKATKLQSGPKPVPKVGSSPNRSLVPKPHSYRTETR